MKLTELFLIGVGLSMDALAVSICKGLGMRRLNWRHAAIIALFFGFFQGAMPFLGWLLGSQFERYITNIDHWIAAALLGYIGGKMLWDSFHDDEETSCRCDDKPDYRELTVMAVATSIDALAVGISFAFLQVSIGSAVGVIASTTFVICLAGVAIGHRFGSRFKNKATFAGGLILCGIGLKILLEHLGLLAL